MASGFKLKDKMKKDFVTTKILCTLLISLVIGLSANANPRQDAPKRFKRALIIAGGGISPGVGLGILAAAEERGWKPDVVITTCGASMAAAIYNSARNGRQALRVARSEGFREGLQETSIATPQLLKMKKKFDSLREDYVGRIPPVFDTTVMHLPLQTKNILANQQFNSRSDTPRFIMIGARASFGPRNVGERIGGRDLFKQVLFTDSETALDLEEFTSPIASSFPRSHVASAVEVVTERSTTEALRASVSDPYLLNPAQLGGDYYFTGAVDLFPVELAELLAEEVFVTAPSSLYSSYEDLAIESTFGFKQTTRALQILNNRNVKWIDMAGAGEHRFDPVPVLLRLRDRIPRSPENFDQGIVDQFNFGYHRMTEALQLQKGRAPTRRHMREPINPALYQDFSCKNANLWYTARNPYCKYDHWEGCNRETEWVCTPIR